MKAEVKADIGTICDKAYCILEVDGYTFRLSSSEYGEITDWEEYNHIKAITFFQKIAYRINNENSNLSRIIQPLD